MEGRVRMPRVARKKSSTGIYHVMVRGVNKQDIFLSKNDRLRYLQTIAMVKDGTASTVLGYCLMGNHAHLLLKEGQEATISQVMQRIGTSYVQWFNAKSSRVGHLFQDRFLSVPVELDSQILSTLRYIHQNPVKAGIASDCMAYPWSSHNAYERGIEVLPGLTDTSLAIQIAGGLAQLLDFLNEPNEDSCHIERIMAGQETHKVSDEEMLDLLRSWLPNGRVDTLRNMAVHERDEILRKLKCLSGTSLGQIARVTGFSKATVHRA